MMRTTIDLPDDLHRILTAVARDLDQSLSQTVTGILRERLTPGEPPSVYSSPLTGLPVVHFGHVVTIEDVRQLDDE